MPTVGLIGPYRIFFYSADCSEPAHVHVERDESVAKIWLHDLRLAKPGGFRAAELARIIAPLRELRTELLRQWNEHCSG